MCIRDRPRDRRKADREGLGQLEDRRVPSGQALHDRAPRRICLLYTSDAADERSSVDLGGRRLIQKKKNKNKNRKKINKKNKEHNNMAKSRHEEQ